MQTANAIEEEKASLNFVNADIESVIKAIGQISGKNFIIDPRVKGTINIASATPIPPSMAYQVLLSALRTQGFTATESNGIITILPEADAKMRYSPTVSGNNKVRGDQIITQVFVIKYESANLLVPILKPLISPNNIINAYPNNNMLVITDYAENLRKVAKLISTIDQPSSVENEVIKIKYANAVELTQVISKLVETNTGAEQSRKMIVVAEPRSNSIILRSDNAGQVSRAKNLIQQLDARASSGNSIHVVYLRNADAKKLAATLQALTANSSDAFSSVDNTTKSTPMITNGVVSSATNANPTVLNLVTPITATTAMPFSESNTSSSPSSSMIQADSSTNALIITAPDHVFNMLRGVIDKLDIRRAQLYIEALVAEVSTDKASEFGIQWQDLQSLGGNSNNIRSFSGTKFSTNGASITSVAQNVGSASNGLNIGLFKGQINVPGLGTITNLGVLAHALESDANANILSKPNLLTLDNEEAKIVIGQNVPFITGQYAQTSGGSINPFQTIERKDVGLTLKVKPQISESDTIKLQIYQEVSSVSDSANSAGITTNKRSIETSVMVDDGNIIVLGGLIEDRITETINKVPLLGDIPVLGNLFKTQGREHKKTNLMVFLRPYVMRDGNAANTITNDRYEYIRNQEALVSPKPNWILPDFPVVEMPDIDKKLYTKPLFEKEMDPKKVESSK
ncbi:MAG: type II secretion system secretin GspD [Methylophilaceae bacterium]|nr:type II secretion system secretin GspD [Methylophilaceae bacterium]